ncbi:MAG: ATP-binding protein [Myxococcota bacterium]|nr:ATP-binding protein [Myxococcota bacterium]
MAIEGDEASASARVPQEVWLEAHHRRWMRWLSIAVPPVFAAQAAVQYFVYDLSGAAAALLAGAALAPFTSLVAARLSVAVAYQFLCAVAISAIACVGWFRGGFFIIAAQWMLLPPFGALLLGMRRTGVVWALIAIGIIGALFTLEHAGLAPPRVPASPYVQLANLLAMAFFLIGPGAYGVRNLEIRHEVLAQQARDVARERRMEALGRFAGGIAHDLNNLLAVIRAGAEFLRPEEPSQLEAREDILEAVTRGAELTGGLLAFAREEDQTGSTTELSRALPRVAALARRLLPRNVELDVRAEARGWLEVGSGALDRAILNLCSNARDAMPEGGRIALTSDVTTLEPGEGPAPLRARPGRYARVSVRDGGEGMSDETRARIFEPFFSTKAASGAGTGLGLGSVLALADAAGGAVEVESELGRGTCVRLWLPVLDRAPRAAKTTQEREDLAARVRGRRVLIVDDDAPLRRGVARLLQATGAWVREASNAAEARAAAERSPIDVVLCALELEDGRGADLARELLVDQPQLTILIVSGGQVATEALPGTRVLRKPFTREALLEALAPPGSSAAEGAPQRRLDGER